MSSRREPSSDETQDAQLASRVGAAIAEIRRARGLTQAKLAEMIDLEQEAISRWERGMRAPTLYRLQQLSDALECSVDQLLQRGSKRVDDQLATVADALHDLDANERALVVRFVQQFAELLQTQRASRGKSRK
ncbi:helix-turn-helix domain-containing protein [Burkholderia cenocepacia]|uniref:helix-turn-helix domain-containing protein n=1 Tax=Burkholderia cenocepacia TaxID=95486 RepID=UPI00098EAE9B|nr:helix-turn-helix transcriptional regulator [Burkholderia cenocepacia]